MLLCMEQALFVIADTETNLPRCQFYTALLLRGLRNIIRDFAKVLAPVRLQNKLFRVCLIERSTGFCAISFCKRIYSALIGGFFIL